MSEKQVVSRHGSLMVYQDLLVATLPLLAMAVFLYGPRPALLWLAAVSQPHSRWKVMRLAPAFAKGSA